MNKVVRFLFFITFITISQTPAFSQSYARTFKKYRYTSIGFCANAMNYVGEVDPGPSFLSPAIKFTRYNFGATYTKRLAPRYSVRGAVSWGRIKGDDFQNASFNDRDIYRKFRNLSFRNNIFEIKADFIVDLWENRGRHTKRPDYVPYGFVGLAYFHHNPKALYHGNWVALRPLHTEGKNYSLNQVAIPIGLGFRYKLSKQWDLAFEMGWRFTLTDYLDDVSRFYTSKASFGGNQMAIDLSDRSGELMSKSEMDPYLVKKHKTYLTDPYNSTGKKITGYGDQGDQRGDKNRDWYIITGFHLNYILPGRVICPKFRTYHKEVEQKLLAYNY